MPITVTNLTCVYGAGTPFETTALRDVSVTVENGSFVGILGRTGCGKSTLIQIMAGLLTPTAGTVMLDGQDIHARRYDRSILRRKVGIVFQYPECQLFETTVEKDVAFGLKHSGLSTAEKQARVRCTIIPPTITGRSNQLVGSKLVEHMTTLYAPVSMLKRTECGSYHIVLGIIIVA